MSPRPKRRASAHEGASEPSLSVVAKTCEQCRQSKPRADFFPTGATPDLLTRKCKQCIAANADRDRQDREARKADVAARAKAVAEAALSGGAMQIGHAR